MLKKVLSFFLMTGFIISCPVAGFALDSSGAPYQWTGAYVGLNAGWARGIADTNTNTVSPFPFAPWYFAPQTPAAIAQASQQRPNGDGFVGGGQIGYNYQAKYFVIGAEADFSYMGTGGSRTCTAPYPQFPIPFPPGDFTTHSSFHTEWLFTVRPRIGFAMDNWLFYATGGFSLTDLTANFQFNDHPFFNMYESSKISSTRFGWSFGGGMEIGLAKNWSVKNEYLYTDFGRASTTSFFSGSSIPGFVALVGPYHPFTHTIDLKTHMVRFGLNYRF